MRIAIRCYWCNRAFGTSSKAPDHLLFLLALLVPVLIGAGTVRWRALLALITAFTVGHSVTLALTTFGVWAPPVRIVECAIAATVILAGINIAVPLFRDRSVGIALLFGLIHGCGLANALLDLNLPRAQFALALLQFNLGVEAGQLMVVVMAVPVLMALQRLLDRRYLQPLSALVTTGMGCLWLLQRVA